MRGNPSVLIRPPFLLRACLLAAALAAVPTPSASAEEPGPAGWARNGGGFSTAFRGPRMVIDWSTAAQAPSHRIQGPVHVRLYSQDGRFIARRQARRSAQGWITSLRIAGWPAGVYQVVAETESGGHRSEGLLSLPGPGLSQNRRK